MNGMENKLELYIVRHGETEWNKEGRLQGWLDSNLTKMGIEQVMRLKGQLQDISFDAAFSSPSKRAYDTAEILVGHYLTIEKDARLQEIHLGSWQGKRIAEIQNDDAERYEEYCCYPERYTPDAGESFQQVIQRMDEFVQFCARKLTSGKILVVSHGVAIRALILSSLRLPIQHIWDFEIEGASVTKIIVTKENRMIEYIGKVF